MRRLWGSVPLTVMALVLGGASCSDGGGGGGADADTGDTTVQPDGQDSLQPVGRPYFLGGRAEGYDFAASGEPRPWHPDTAPLAGDLSEVAVIPLDLYGIPWESFDGPGNRPANLPGAWLSGINALKAQAAATGKPIVLAMTPLSPNWDTLAPDARDQGGILVLNDLWRPNCYDPSTDGNPTKWRDAYAGFAVWAVEEFEPDWVILGQRMNRYEENCGASAYTSLTDYVREADTRIKALTPASVARLPTTIVGVDVEDLYGFPKKAGRCVAVAPKDCLAERQSLLDGLAADVIGLESYPAFALPQLTGDLPSDWLAAVAALRPSVPKAIIGTSLPAASMSSRQGTLCIPLFTSSPEDQVSWLDQAIAAATDFQMPLMIWRSLTDLLDGDVVSSCPCAGDVPTCQHLDQLSGLANDVRRLVAAGLVAQDGTERLGVTVWRQAMLED